MLRKRFETLDSGKDGLKPCGRPLSKGPAVDMPKLIVTYDSRKQVSKQSSTCTSLVTQICHGLVIPSWRNRQVCVVFVSGENLCITKLKRVSFGT